ncbi:hypothetical protein IWW55_007370, partial [Coemansia sp. RSA 2706]
EQLALLEGTFKTTPKPSSEVRKSLASRLCMTAREVQIWFQNRRAKQKNMLLRASSAARSAAGSPPASAAASAAPVAAPASIAAPPPLVPSAVPHAGGVPNAAACAVPHTGPSAAGPMPSGPMSASLISALLPPSAATKHARAASADRSAPAVSPGAGRRDAGVARRYSDIPVFGELLTASTASTSKKKRRDEGRFDVARVHQEAFDGTNKLPVKPDDLSPTADEQFSMLDPANLPNFMAPPPPPLGALPMGDLWMPYGAMPPPDPLHMLGLNLPFAPPPQSDPLADAAFYQSLLLLTQAQAPRAPDLALPKDAFAMPPPRSDALGADLFAPGSQPGGT